MSEHPIVYYARRAAEELERAESSTCPDAAEAHREMHRRYMQMIDELNARRTEPGLLSVGSSLG